MFISTSLPTFLSILKLGDITTVHKKDFQYMKNNYLNFLKIYCMTKFTLFLKALSLNIKLVSGKAVICKVV